MKFDVIIPAYNASEYLPETLDSILGQSHAPHQVIVVDDGSTDNTAEIARTYSPIVQCTTIENSGCGYARKIGIDIGDSPWIALCDADDLWREDHLERRCNLLKLYPDASYTFSDFYAFGPDSDPDYRRSNEAPPDWYKTYQTERQEGYFKVKNPYQAFLEFNPSFVCGMVFSRVAYYKMGGFLKKYSRWNSEDSEFTRRFLLSEDCVVAGDSEATWGYRRHDSNYSKNQWKNSLARARILTEHKNLGIVPEKFIEQQNIEIRNAYVESLTYAYWSRDLDAIRTIFLEANKEHYGILGSNLAKISFETIANRLKRKSN